MSPAQAFVVANPFAGRGRAREIAEASVRDLATHGVTAELLLPTDLPSLRTALTQAAADGPTTFLACGGDGTVHQILQVAVGADCVLGVIPAGTGNDNARSMGIDTSRLMDWTRRLADMIKVGASTRIDVDHDGEGLTAAITWGYDTSDAVATGALRLTPHSPEVLLAPLGGRDYVLVYPELQRPADHLLAGLRRLNRVR